MYYKISLLIIIISCLIYYIQYYKNEYEVHNHPDPYVSIDDDVGVFSKEELSKYTQDDALYLCILGHIFDVTKGKNYYQKGETYNCFIGRDGTRAFISGNFTEDGLTEDIDDITDVEAIELYNWLEFYKSRYPFKGHLNGRFFDKKGTPTKYWHEFLIKYANGQENNEEILKEKLKYPPCNIQWDQNQGTRVSCSNKSGGIERDWIGVPRKYFQIGKESFRCACINVDFSKSSENIISNRDGKVELYENCHPKSTICFVQNEDE